MLFLMLAAQAVQTAPTPPPMPVRIGKPLKALHPGDWVTNDDYPAEALRQRMEGTVGFELKVDAAGAVTGCAITRPSGFQPLDDKTCELLLQRASFEPAGDADGKPIAATYRSRLRWELPVAVPVPAASWRVTARIVVKADGSVTSCALTKIGTPPASDASTCENLKGKSLWTELPVFGDLAGQPGVVTVDTMLRIEGVGDKGIELAEPGPDALAIRQVAFEIGETGAIENCRAEQRAPGMVSTSSTPSCDIGYPPFKPVLGRDGKPKRVKGLLSTIVSAKLVPPPDPNSPTV